MKIKNIEAKIFELKLQKPVKVAIGEITHGETVIVKVTTDSGLVGYGEGAGIPFITGESCETVLGAVNILSEKLIGYDPWAIVDIHTVMDAALMHNTSAKAAIDIALYDIMGKDANLPLYRLLGGVESKVETDKTISIDRPDIMCSEAKDLVARGFNHIKLKAGLDSKADIQVIKAIRESVGSSIGIKVDANQGWSVSQAIETITDMGNYGVQAVEQPVPYWDIDGFAYIRSKVSVPIMADESCFSPYDAARLIKADAVDMINIKLMKSCGLHKAMEIEAISRAAGVRCMLGCMMESRVAISAAAALVAARDNIIYGDLDSPMFLTEHPAIHGGFKQDGPFYSLGDEPGHGVEVDF